MIGWLVVCLLGPARAAEPDLRALQQEVATLAAEVARARTEGARRQEVEALMAKYRVAAERLRDLRAPIEAAEQDERIHGRVAALTALLDATARGQRDPASREVLAAWLGGVDRATIARLDEALDQAEQDPVLGDALRADVAEVAGALAVCAGYDAALARTEAATDTDRATALRAAARSGAPEALEGVADAERWEHEAAEATARAEEATVLVGESKRLQARATGARP